MREKYLVSYQVRYKYEVFEFYSFKSAKLFFEEVSTKHKAWFSIVIDENRTEEV